MLLEVLVEGHIMTPKQIKLVQTTWSKAVRDLGRRHAEYGVQTKDYNTVGAALLWTLEQGLTQQFTPEVKEAWTAAYTILATTMQQGAAVAAA
jgi:hemoglobin-like flavoprotein